MSQERSLGAHLAADALPVGSGYDDLHRLLDERCDGNVRPAQIVKIEEYGLAILKLMKDASIGLLERLKPEDCLHLRRQRVGSACCSRQEGDIGGAPPPTRAGSGVESRYATSPSKSRSSPAVPTSTRYWGRRPSPG